MKLRERHCRKGEGLPGSDGQLAATDRSCNKRTLKAIVVRISSGAPNSAIFLRRAPSQEFVVVDDVMFGGTRRSHLVLPFAARWQTASTAARGDRLSGCL